MTSEKPITGCGRCPLGPGQAELAGQVDELTLVVVLATPGGVLDPTNMSEGVDGLMEHSLQGLAGPFGQAFPGHEQLGPPADHRQIQRGALAFLGGAALDPVVGAEMAPSGVDVQGGRGEAGAGHHDHLGQLGGAAADVGPGLFEGGDEAGAGCLERRH
jgi:hypothetical protein